jgi:hypothetical protein
MLSLGLAGERAEALAERLPTRQWPDGGWNCDRKARGRTSSFTESLIPLRALHLHARSRSDSGSTAAAAEAGEFFLRGRLYRRLHDGSVINPAFLQLHFPCYWHYDILLHSLCSPRPGNSVIRAAARRSVCWRASDCPMADSQPSTAITGTPLQWCPASAR